MNIMTSPTLLYTSLTTISTISRRCTILFWMAARLSAIVYSNGVFVLASFRLGHGCPALETSDRQNIAISCELLPDQP